MGIEAYHIAETLDRFVVAPACPQHYAEAAVVSGISFVRLYGLPDVALGRLCVAELMTHHADQMLWHPDFRAPA